MISSYPKSTGIPWVDGLSTGPPDLGCHMPREINRGARKLVRISTIIKKKIDIKVRG